MIKKIFILIISGFVSLSSFGYSQLSFGAGTGNYSMTLFDGSSAIYYVDFSGYTEQNLYYRAAYGFETTDYILGAAVIEIDQQSLIGQLGYAFGDLEEGALTFGGSFINWDYSEDGVAWEGTDFRLELAYQRLSSDGINYSVGLTYLTGCDNDQNCEAVHGQAEFPIGASENWNFRVRAEVQQDAYAIAIGPTIKF